MQEKFRVNGQKGLRTLESARTERNRQAAGSPTYTLTLQVESKEMGAKKETERRQCQWTSQVETETVSQSEENVGKKELRNRTRGGVGDGAGGR